MEFDAIDAQLPVPGLAAFAESAFSRLSFTFTKEHLEALASICRTGKNNPNDAMVARFLLENAVVSARGVFPLCQDTGIANVFVWKDDGFAVPGGTATGGDVASEISAGVETAYRTKNLRLSTVTTDDFFSERDPGNNLPAQISVQSTTPRDGVAPACRFLFCAKGGGSSNKTKLVQATKAILTESAFEAWLKAEIPALGTAACPPYSIAVVVGGLSPEQNLLALKLATAGYFDERLPGWDYRVMGVEPTRAPEWERRARDIASSCGLGAQFGGTALALSARVLRLPRHGASCPVSIGVSCCAHRNLRGYADAGGWYLERTVSDPMSLPAVRDALASRNVDSALPQAKLIDLDGGIERVRKELSALRPGTPVFLSGKLLVARDAAHARWRALLADDKPLPAYASEHPILYAGPALTPEGRAIGSFGPTTAGRMDEYADELMKRGSSLVTIAKGNRSEAWRSACERYGATYLGTVGGAAALIAERFILDSKTIDYPELGMEAVRLVTVRDLPSFVLINDRGEDFYAMIRGGKA